VRDENSTSRILPAHWAPNDLLIASNPALPAVYRDGAFIAFHGSWNRAPAPQDGYNVVFQPMKDGKAAGKFIVFADGFAGPIKEPGRAAFRPSGLTQGPDGAIYISDDVHGRIWRVTYHGGPNAALASAPASQVQAAASPRRPFHRRCASRCRARGRSHAADAAGRNPSGSGAWVPYLSRSSQQRDVRRMPRLRRQRQSGRRRPDGGRVALERWKSRGAHQDDFGGRRYAEKASGRHAAAGRLSSLCRGLEGGVSLRMGDRSPALKLETAGDDCYGFSR